MITTQRQLRRNFWNENPRLDRRRINCGPEKTYVTDTRVAWCDYVEHLRRSGLIPEELAQRATL